MVWKRDFLTQGKPQCTMVVEFGPGSDDTRLSTEPSAEDGFVGPGQRAYQINLISVDSLGPVAVTVTGTVDGDNSPLWYIGDGRDRKKSVPLTFRGDGDNKRRRCDQKPAYFVITHVESDPCGFSPHQIRTVTASAAEGEILAIRNRCSSNVYCV